MMSANHSSRDADAGDGEVVQAVLRSPRRTDRKRTRGLVQSGGRNVSSRDAKLEQRLAELNAKWGARWDKLDAKLEQRLAQLDAKWGVRWDKLDAKLEQRLAEFEATLERRLGEQTRWLFVAWASLLIPIIGLWIRG
jgi:hypothetical protein